MRLDIFLQERYPKLSRAHLQRLIRGGLVYINKIPQTKNGAVVRDSDSVTVDHDFDKTEQSAYIDLPVLYEDSDCVVINKPVGVLTHSKGAFTAEATVASWLAGRADFAFESDEGNDRAGIVHRLDRATSGVMICAKNHGALKHLQKQFQDRKAKKVYIARVQGEVTPPEALIDLPIERNPKQPSRFRVGQNGKSAQTNYKLIQTVQRDDGKYDSLIELKPYTGRTHQLRVHLLYLKHPIIGDTFYDGRSADRLYLHAAELEITLPNKNRQTFTAQLPDAFYKQDI